MCNFSIFLTLQKAMYASPGLNLLFVGVISMTISGSVSPWHLCIVTAQASVNGKWLLVAWYDVFLCIGNVACVWYIGTAFWFVLLWTLVCIASCPTCLLSNDTNMALIFLVFHQLLHLLLYPLHHLLTHQLHQY